MIDRQNFLDQPVRNDIRTYDSIQKIVTGQEDACKIGSLLACNYLKISFKMIAIDLGQQKAYSANPKAIKQINFAGNQSWAESPTMFFIIKKPKETILDF